MMMVHIAICDDAGPAHETGPWADISERIARPSLAVERVAVLNRGTVGGRPSVLLASRLPDGRYTITEITGDMWETIAGAIRGARARWGIEDRA